MKLLLGLRLPARVVVSVSLCSLRHRRSIVGAATADEVPWTSTTIFTAVPARLVGSEICSMVSPTPFDWVATLSARHFVNPASIT